MKALIIDTTWERAVLVLIDGDKRYSYVSDTGARRHSPTVLAEADRLFTEAGLKPSDLDAVGAVVGPGSFTGIRIGVATANAMAKATGAKIVEITELEAMIEGETEALALIDCKHDNYYALKRAGGRDEYFAANIADIDEPGLKRVFFAGEITDKLTSVFIRKYNAGEFVAEARPFYIKKSSAEA